MTENIINMLMSAKGKATKSQKVLIEYLLTSNLNDIIYLSITELSDITGVGEATILRFCRVLGFKGYQDFKLVIAQEISPNLVIGEDKSYITTIASNMIESINSSKDSTELAVIEKVIDVLTESKNISIFGVGNSYVPALELHNRLLKLGILSYSEQGSHNQNIFTASLSKDDCVVLFSVSGCTKDVIEVAEIAKQHGVKIIVVTSHDKSPLAKYADIVVKCMRKESPTEGGSMLTKIGQLFIVDVISTGLSIRDLNHYNKCIKRASVAVVKKLV